MDHGPWTHLSEALSQLFGMRGGGMAVASRHLPPSVTGRAGQGAVEQMDHELPARPSPCAEWARMGHTDVQFSLDLERLRLRKTVGA